jgi:hypothetical protein
LNSPDFSSVLSLLLVDHTRCAGLVGDLLGKVIALPKLFPNDLDDVIGVAVTVLR